MNGFGILTSIVKLSRKHNPILFFSALASFTIIPALGILGWVFYRQYISGAWHSGWALIGVLMLLFGTQAVAVGAMSALMKRMEQRISQRIEKSNSKDGRNVS